MTGAEGNREFFLHLGPGGERLDAAEDLEAARGKAVLA